MNYEKIIEIEKSIHDTHISRGMFFSEEAFDAMKNVQRSLQAVAGKDISTNRIMNLMLIHYGELFKEAARK